MRNNVRVPGFYDPPVAGRETLEAERGTGEKSVTSVCFPFAAFFSVLVDFPPGPFYLHP